MASYLRSLEERLYHALVPWTPNQIPDLRGKVALVTGGNSGMGFEVCRKLAENGARVYMVSRDLKRGEAAAVAIRHELGPRADVRVIESDLSEMNNVLQLVSEFKHTGDPLHILVNNAGVFFPGKLEKTHEDLEHTLAVNFYAGMLLSLGLLEALCASAPARIVFVSSYGEGLARRVEWNNLKGDKSRESGVSAYAHSKLYEIMFAQDLQEKIIAKHGYNADKPVDVFAVNTGLVATPGIDKMDRRHYWMPWLIKLQSMLYGQKPYRGATSTLYAATEHSIAGTGFKYFGPNRWNLFHTRERSPDSPDAHDPSARFRLTKEAMAVMEQVVGQYK